MSMELSIMDTQHSEIVIKTKENSLQRKRHCTRLTGGPVAVVVGRVVGPCDHI